MTDLYALLNQTANQLQAEGKTPSLALIRARLKGQDPAKLFSAYQQWRACSADQHSAKSLADESKAVLNQTLAEQSPELDLQKIQQDLTRIESKLDQLLNLLNPQLRDPHADR